MRGEPHDDGTGQLVALVVAALLCLALACGEQPRPVTPTVVEVVAGACLDDPPPRHVPIDVDGPSDRCAVGALACHVLTWALDRVRAPYGAYLTPEAAAALGQHLAAVRRYSDGAYDRCGPAPAEGTTP